MKTTSVRRAALSCALLASTACLAVAAAPAAAQTGSPAFRNLDENGVDLVRGDFVMSFEEGSIGSGDARLALIRQNAGSSFSQWDGYTFRRTVSGTTTTIDVGRAGRFVDRFVNGVATKANGATIAISSGGYTYTTDGTTVVFTDLSGGDQGLTNFCGSSGTAASCELAPTAINMPDGSKVTLDWQTRFTTSFLSGQPVKNFAFRLWRVSNNFGYRISFVYQYLSPGMGALDATWYQRQFSRFFNDNLSTTTVQAEVGYTYPSSGLVRVTDMAGKPWDITETSIKRPGETSPGFWLEGSASAVSAVNRDGVRTRYTRTVSGTTVTMTVKDTLDNETIVTANSAVGRPASVTNAKGETTTFTYDSSNRLTDVAQPEGNSVHYELDARGNVKETRLLPKGGGATISTFADFDATCSNPRTCNKPNATRDALGNQTDYTWDPTHGGLAKVRLPKAENIIASPRPEARYTYTQVTNPITGVGTYQLTGISQCQTTHATGAQPPQLPCGNAEDEMKQGFGYDARGNLVSTSAGNGSGTLTASVSRAYDAMGNLLTVDGPLAGDADTTRYRYDAARRLVAVISPDPDGT